MVLRESVPDPGATRSVLAAARLGDAQAFETLVEPYRHELHLHCYRMTGSLTDADDMLQESLLKAWRAIDSFEDRAFRAWLYKIATNTCLNELAARGRSRFLSARPWSGGPPALAEIEHLQPYPDRLMDDAADPAARFDLKESVALAFIAVIQLLPPRRRLWLRGRAAIVDFLSTVPAYGHLEQIRLVPVGSNRQPALAAFIAEPDDGGHQYYGVMVFSFEDGAISAITGFADSTFNDYFGLPCWLPADSEG